MHTVELLDEAVAVAQQLGFVVRQEWLGGNSGCCEMRGQKWLFIDLAQSPQDQLDLVVGVLRDNLARMPLVGLSMTPELARLVRPRKIA